jgi:ABC-type multidrug transport system fused ATPase/permease subunit
LRLLELQSGSIELDGIDIRRVSLDRLRQRCFVTVSQNPFLLPNDTLRFNLDPSISVPDDVLITALTTVGLWLHFCNGTAHVSGTFSRLGEHPVSDQKLSLLRGLSAGQCQLLGVCRALVKTSSLRDSGVKAVVLLDEVTSSLDVATESAIHHTIDVEVLEKGHTVIVVAHRLGSLDEMKAGRDVVVVMADGRVRKVIDSDLVF